MAKNNKVTTDTSKPGELNVNVTVSNNDKAPTNIPSINQAALKESSSKKSKEKTDVNKPKVTKSAASNNEIEILNRISETLTNLYNATISIRSEEVKGPAKSSGGSGGSKFTSEMIGAALIQSFADNAFIRSMTDALNKFEFNSEFTTTICQQIENLAENVSYSIKDTDKTDNKVTVASISTPEGNKTKTEYSTKNVLTDEVTSLIAKSTSNNKDNQTPEASDNKISEIETIVNKTTENRVEHLNTTSPDKEQNELNLALQEQLRQLKPVQAETESINQDITSNILDDKVERNESAIEKDTIENGEILQKVILSEISQDLMISDKDIKTRVEEEQAFVESIEQNFETLIKTDEDSLSQLDKIAEVNSKKNNKSPKDNGIEDIAKSIKSMAGNKQGEDIDKKPKKIINDSADGEMGGIIKKQNNRISNTKNVSSKGSKSKSGLSALGKLVSLIGGKEKKEPNAPPKDTKNGLVKQLPSINNSIMRGLTILSQIYGIIPNISKNISKQRCIY